MDKKLVIILVIIALTAGTGLGYFLGFNKEHAVLNKKLSTIQPIRNNTTAYKFIDPLLAYIIPSADQESGLTLLKNKVNNFIESQKKNNNIFNASAFFYDLNRGRWIGVSESEKYSPASMLKVVIMVAYLKESETDKNVLNKYLLYTKNIDDFVGQDFFNKGSVLKVGSAYTVEDLINKMIIYSDNGAANLLLSNIDQIYLDSIYSALNIENPLGQKSFTISPRTYSLFLRILYSSTYLNDADSEKALELLSKTTFTDGLVAGVPKDITVSHKFGQNATGQSKQIELHDCGIIYHPSDPYLLCVMTKGENLDKLENVIKGISSIVYQNYSDLK